jgi:hypothetical protein
VIPTAQREAPTTAGSSGRAAPGVLIRTWAPVLLLVAIPVLLVSLHVHAYTKLSPTDELQHIDYLFRSPGVHPVAAGTQDGQPAMREEVCRGVDAKFALPPCTSKTLSSSHFQDQGYDTAYVHPPTYYDATWAAGEVVRLLTGAKSWVTVWRLVGALWLAVGLLLTYAAGLRMGVGRLPLVGLLILLASTPSILQTNSTITPDAASTFVGGAALYFVCRWQAGGKWRWLWLVGVGFVGTAIKLQDVIVVMMVVLYLLLSARDGTGDRASLPTPPDGVRYRSVRLVRSAQTRAVAVVLLTSAVVGATWTVIQRVTQTIDPNKLLVNKQFVVTSISPEQIAATFGVFLAPLPGAYFPASTENVWTNDMVSLLSWLLIAGVVAGALFRARNRHMASLAQATLLTALLGGPLYVVLNFVSISQYIPMPTRYGFALLPAMVLCTADAIRARWAGLCVVGAGLSSVAFVAYRMA